MRPLLAVLVVAVCLAPATAGAAAATTAADASTEQVTITVVVVNENENPVGGANVTVTYDDTSKSQETFSNGKVFFDVPEGADVEVDVEHPDLALNAPVDAENVDGSTEVQVQMFPAATAVIDVEDPSGNPIEGATVRLRKSDEVLTYNTGQTAANGTFTASDLEQGNYSVTVKSAGYYEQRTSVYVSQRSGKTVTLEPGTVTVEFRTIDGHFADERSLSATVELYSNGESVAQLSTGSSGTRAVSLDVNTQYRVVVTKDGYSEQTQTLRTDESDSSVTYSLNRTPGLSVTPANSQVVTGQSVRVTVTDEYDEPVAGASIQVAGETVAETDENGQALVTIDSAGDVTVTAVSGSLESTATVQGVEPSTEGTTTTAATTTAGTATAPTTAATTTEATTEATTEQDDEDEGGSIPGFGGLVAIVALALSVAALAHRRDQ